MCFQYLSIHHCWTSGKSLNCSVGPSVILSSGGNIDALVFRRPHVVVAYVEHALLCEHCMVISSGRARNPRTYTLCRSVRTRASPHSSLNANLFADGPAVTCVERSHRSDSVSVVPRQLGRIVNRCSSRIRLLSSMLTCAVVRTFWEWCNQRIVEVFL